MITNVIQSGIQRHPLSVPSSLSVSSTHHTPPTTHQHHQRHTTTMSDLAPFIASPPSVVDGAVRVSINDTGVDAQGRVVAITSDDCFHESLLEALQEVLKETPDKKAQQHVLEASLAVSSLPEDVKACLVAKDGASCSSEDFAKATTMVKQLVEQRYNDHCRTFAQNLRAQVLTALEAKKESPETIRKAMWQACCDEDDTDDDFGGGDGHGMYFWTSHLLSSLAEDWKAKPLSMDEIRHRLDDVVASVDMEAGKDREAIKRWMLARPYVDFRGYY